MGSGRRSDVLDQSSSAAKTPFNVFFGSKHDISKEPLSVDAEQLAWVYF